MGRRIVEQRSVSGIQSNTRPWKRIVSIIALASVAILLACTAWLVSRLFSVRDDLQAAVQSVQTLQNEGSVDDLNGAKTLLESAADRTQKARETTSDPVWKLSTSLPFIGPNIAALTEVVVSADDLFTLGALPLVSAIGGVDLASLVPEGGVVDVSAIDRLRPTLVSTANTVQFSYDRMMSIDDSQLAPQLAAPLTKARTQLSDVRSIMNSLAAAGELIPGMLGKDEPRSYLLLIQNSAETRATGGIPGALAVITADGGGVTLESQDSATGLGMFVPALEVDSQQEDIYTARLGTHMQNVNLTPHFPTAAATAQQMWEQRHPQQPIDGVIALDTMVLAHLLEATGPVKLSDPQVLTLIDQTALPSALTKENVVPTLLSDVYREVENPVAQDAYFAAVAGSVFSSLTGGGGDGNQLVQALGLSAKERRLYLWSSHASEQSIIESTALAGSVQGPAAGGATFGVYFNDGTGAKMDYYASRRVQLIQECGGDGYGEFTVRLETSNQLQVSAAASLPAYVTGSGTYGVEPGRIRTNYVFYGPDQSFAETATVNGEPAPLGSGRHGQRPVGTVSVELGPEETAIIDVVFSKVVQDTDPNVVLTPTLQSLEEMVLPLRYAECG